MRSSSTLAAVLGVRIHAAGLAIGVAAALTFARSISIANSAAVTPEHEQQCNLKQYASLNVIWRLPPPAPSLPQVEVTLNGQPARMIFDTGIFVSVINEYAVRQLNLQSKRLPLPITVGSTKLTSYVTV